MSLLEKVKAIFAEETKKETMAEDTFVKTEDGKIISVKGGPLAAEAAVMWVLEDATESVIEDGDYILDDKRTVTVKDGKVSEIKDAPVEEVVEETEMSKQKFAVIKQVSKWSMDIDQDTIELGTILTQTYEDGGEPCPVSAGEYEMENGDTIQVDSEGKVVLITPKGEETVPAVEPTEEAPAPADETMSKVEARLAALEAKLADKEKELEKTKADFNKLKSTPAAKSIDTRKVDMKAENKTAPKKASSMLEAVRNITSK